MVVDCGNLHAIRRVYLYQGESKEV
jgi:hypothetical protein